MFNMMMTGRMFTGAATGTSRGKDILNSFISTAFVLLRVLHYLQNNVWNVL